MISSSPHSLHPHLDIFASEILLVYELFVLSVRSRYENLDEHVPTILGGTTKHNRAEYVTGGHHLSTPHASSPLGTQLQVVHIQIMLQRKGNRMQP